MSLLMQALKKAERNKLDALPDEDSVALPSESYDHVLALTPDDVLSGRVPPAHSAFSLEPMEQDQRPEAAPVGGAGEQVPALEAAIPAPHDPTPPQSRRHTDHARENTGGSYGPHGLHYAPSMPALTTADAALAWTAGSTAMPRPPAPGLALEELPPSLSVAPHDDAPLLDYEESWEAPVPPATPAGLNPVRPGASGASVPTGVGRGAGPGLAAGADAGASADLGISASAGADVNTVAGHGPAAGNGTSAGLGPDAARAGGAATAGNGGASGSPPPGRPRTTRGTAARARAAAQAAAEQDQPRRDPARVRLAVLGAALALVAGTLAGVYWYAVTAPGPGASLPPVPMPAPGARTGPAPVAVVPPAGGQYDSDTDLPPAVLPDSAAPGVAPPASVVAPGYAGLPPGRTAAPPLPHAGSRMPSDDDLQRAVQQQGQPHGEAAPGFGTPPATPNPQAATSPATPSGTANAPQPAAAVAAPGDIHVAHSTVAPRVNAALQEGYQSFMAGDYATAAQQYALALRQDPNNRDALLGNAAIAARRNDINAATSGYQRLLELNPSDPDAQAGLLALRPGDPGRSEMRLKELLRREPGAGPLEFALGNLYAQQGRWPDAQQAYFRAYSAMPDNADYAFNLAVGLDRLSQRKLALTYYQRALDLSRTSPAAFDRAAARRRAEQLAGRAGGPAAPSADGATVPATAPASAATAAATPGAASAPPALPDNAAGNGRQP